MIGDANADKSGRFRLDVPRTSSSRDDMFLAIAMAPGYGLGWVEIDPDADQPIADVTLWPEQVIDGRLFDVQGRPVHGALVSVAAIQRVLMPDSECLITPRGRFEGPYFGRSRVNDWPAWPKPATTDADGRLTVRGVGRGLEARLIVIDPRFAQQVITVVTDHAADAKFVTMALVPAKIIVGRVTYADTGLPVPRTPIVVSASGAGQFGSLPTYFETDADGRFRLNPSPGDRFNVSANPPSGKPYLAASAVVDWPKGAVERALDLALIPWNMWRGEYHRIAFNGRFELHGLDHNAEFPVYFVLFMETDSFF